MAKVGNTGRELVLRGWRKNGCHCCGSPLLEGISPPFIDEGKGPHLPEAKLSRFFLVRVALMIQNSKRKKGCMRGRLMNNYTPPEFDWILEHFY